MTSPEITSAQASQPKASAPHGPAGDIAPFLHARRPARRRCWRQRGGMPGRPSCFRRRVRPSRCRIPIPVRRWKRLPPIHRAVPSRSSGEPWSPDDFAGAALVVAAADDEGEAQPHLRMRRALRRAGQRDRQARLLHLPVRRHRQPLAAGRRHLDRWRGAHLRPGHPLAHRGADPLGLRPLGHRRQAMARRSQAARSGTGGAAALLGAFRRPGACRAGPAAAGAGPQDVAGRGPRRRSGAGLGGSCHAGRRRARQSRAADARGLARAALGRCHPVRRPGRARDPRFRAPRGQAHAGRQDRLRSLLQAGRHQCPDGGACQVRQARGAAEVRRPHDLRPRRRGDRSAGARPASPSRSCPASRRRKAPPQASRCR